MLRLDFYYINYIFVVPDGRSNLCQENANISGKLFFVTSII